MASGPITSWEIEGEKMEAVTDFIFLGSKITMDSDCSHEIKTLAPWKESYGKYSQHSTNHRHHFADKVCYGFSIIMYRCKSWTIKKVEFQRADVFELW